MLEKIRLDRPSVGLHTKCILPYPFSEYGKLTEKEQFEWRMNN